MAANEGCGWLRRVAEWLTGKGSSGGKEREAQEQCIHSGRVPTVVGETRIFQLPGRVKLEMVWCPPGSFVMGNLEGGAAQHQVTLTEGFWMAKYPVTQKQWKRVMGTRPSHFKGDSFPVEHVSWRECQVFCRKTGLALPTEAQWEYACRAGSADMCAEPEKLAKLGWFSENSGWKMCPVGRKLPNAWGLHDMYGSVWEWCMDADEVYGERIIRGGSCFESTKHARSAFRSTADPDFKEDPFGAPIQLIGFRPIARQD